MLMADARRSGSRGRSERNEAESTKGERMVAREWCIATTVGIAPAIVNPQDEGCAGRRRASTTDWLRFDEQWRHELPASPLRGTASAGSLRDVRPGGLRRHVGRHPMAVLGP